MRIDFYQFGEIVIAGKTYRSDVIVFPDRVNSSWWRKKGHLLQIEDLVRILEAKPEVLVVGTGYYGVMAVPEDLKKQISGRSIELYDLRTRQAVSIYNRLAGKKKVIAALHLTC
jgi:hypothetical protein